MNKHTYCRLEFHTDSIARSDGISVASCSFIEKLNLNKCILIKVIF